MSILIAIKPSQSHAAPYAVRILERNVNVDAVTFSQSDVKNIFPQSCQLLYLEDTSCARVTPENTTESSANRQPKHIIISLSCRTMIPSFITTPVPRQITSAQKRQAYLGKQSARSILAFRRNVHRRVSSAGNSIALRTHVRQYLGCLVAPMHKSEASDEIPSTLNEREKTSDHGKESTAAVSTKPATVRK